MLFHPFCLDAIASWHTVLISSFGMGNSIHLITLFSACRLRKLCLPCLFPRTFLVPLSCCAFCVFLHMCQIQSLVLCPVMIVLGLIVVCTPLKIQETVKPEHTNVYYFYDNSRQVFFVRQCLGNCSYPFFYFTYVSIYFRYVFGGSLFPPLFVVGA